MNAYKDSGNFTLFWDALQWIHLAEVEGALAVVPVSNYPPAMEGLSLQDFKQAAKPITLSVKVKRNKRTRNVSYRFQDVAWSTPKGEPRPVAGLVVYARTPKGSRALGFVSIGHRPWLWPTLPGDEVICKWSQRAAIEVDLSSS